MRVWLCGLLLALAPASLQAASFDCGKATAPVDQLICASPALSEMDERLAAAFKQAQSQPETDSAALLSQQRQWLRGRQSACAVPKPLPDDKAPLTACLTSQYQTRLDALAHPPKAEKGDDSLCQAVAGALRERAKDEKTDWRYPTSVMTQGDAPVVIKTPNELKSGNDIIKFFKNKFHTDLRKSPNFDTISNANNSLSQYNTSNTSLYMLEYAKGSAHCSYQYFIRATAKDGAKEIDGPSFVNSLDPGEVCGGTYVMPTTISGTPAIVLEYGFGQEDVVNFDMAPYLDPNWGKSCRVEIAFNIQQMPIEHQWQLQPF